VHGAKILAEHNLRLHDDGTRIVNFDKGFDFIGYLFARSLALKEKTETPAPHGKPVKSQVTEEGVIELEDKGSRFDPGKRVLYVFDPSHSLATRNRSFSVLRDDGSELIAISNHRIGRIEVGPGVDFSRKPIDLALEAGIEIALLDGYGQTKGIAMGGGDGRRGSAVRAGASCFRRNIEGRSARKLVEARIRNQRTQLMRLNRDRGIEPLEQILEEMKRTLRKLEGAGTGRVARIRRFHHCEILTSS
jgi:CRISPR-associated protein Cas1